VKYTRRCSYANFGTFFGANQHVLNNDILNCRLLFHTMCSGAFKLIWHQRSISELIDLTPFSPQLISQCCSKWVLIWSLSTFVRVVVGKLHVVYGPPSDITLHLYHMTGERAWHDTDGSCKRLRQRLQGQCLSTTFYAKYGPGKSWKL